MQKLDLSIIIPAFNEAQSIPQLYNLITDKLSKKRLSYEVILIDDGSNDAVSYTHLTLPTINWV